MEITKTSESRIKLITNDGLVYTIKETIIKGGTEIQVRSDDGFIRLEPESSNVVTITTRKI